MKFVKVALLMSVVPVVTSTDLIAQSSVYSVAGLGAVGRPLSARARALGGGVGMFDRTSGLNPASVRSFRSVVAAFTSQTSNRSYDIGSESVSGLRDTRFPNAMAGGQIGNSSFSFAVGYSQFADRSFDLSTSGTLNVRGEDVELRDRVTSDGGISDMRGVLGMSLASNRIHLGVSGHIVGGSTRSTITRVFDSPAYTGFVQQDDFDYEGAGAAAGVVLTPARVLQVGASVRWNTNLDVTLDSTDVGSVELPLVVGLGLDFRPMVAVHWATSFVWNQWSSADDDIQALGRGRAFDSWEIGSGVEIGGAGPGTSPFPIRFGARYARLPFSVNTDQPKEYGFSVGSGIQFSQNRAQLEATLERVTRSGAGAEERAWIFTLGFEVRP